jgi:hypothetical protein
VGSSFGQFSPISAFGPLSLHTGYARYNQVNKTISGTAGDLDLYAATHSSIRYDPRYQSADLHGGARLCGLGFHVFSTMQRVSPAISPVALRGPQAAQLINQIVLNGETDGPNGEPVVI